MGNHTAKATQSELRHNVGLACTPIYSGSAIYYKDVTRGSDPDLTEVIDSLATRHLCGFTTTWALIVTWDHVGYYSERSDNTYCVSTQKRAHVTHLAACLSASEVLVSACSISLCKLIAVWHVNYTIQVFCRADCRLYSSVCVVQIKASSCTAD